MPAEQLTAKGRQTRQAIEQAARKLFAERGFHGTTLADITSAAGKSPAVFYRYFTDKEDLLAALAESFLHDVVAPSGLSVHLPDSPDDDAFFTSVVTGYWNMFKQNIGIMIAVAQLAAAGVDTLITGELREEWFNYAQEHRLNLICCGHYATEVHGVKALAAELAKKFRLPWEFIETENPL